MSTAEEPAVDGSTARRRAIVDRVRGQLNRVVRPSLVDRVPRDHWQTDQAFRRRRVVVIVTLIVGATLLGVSLSVHPGDALFYYLTFALAAVWVIGGFASGPLHLGRIISGASKTRRPIVAPILIGLAVSAVYILGALVVRQVPLLRDYTENVLAHARYGSTALVLVITLVNGIAEEVYFRGALYAGIGVRHPVAISTVVYTIATVAAGNPMLVFAACTLGVVLALQRRASGGVLAPILTHVTWSAVMYFALPPIFAAAS